MLYIYAIYIYMWVGMDRIVNIGDRSSKSTFGAISCAKM